jgi:hypothetical protein
MGNDGNNDDIDDMIYKGIVTPQPDEHDSFFGSKKGKGQHFTIQEDHDGFVEEEG